MDDDEMQHLAQSHKQYLNTMIAEQEAALNRFQNSAYLSDSTAPDPSHLASSMRGGLHTRDLNNTSLQLSASATPYTFTRQPSNSMSQRQFTAAPTPGYGRPGVRSTSPTLSSSSGGSHSRDVANSSLMVNARRILAEAATGQWQEGGHGHGGGGGGFESAAAASASAPFARSRHGLAASSAGMNDTSLSTATLTNEVEAKMWQQDKQAWERRMAELEERLKRVNSAPPIQTAAAPIVPPSPTTTSASNTQLVPSTQPYNVPIVNGRPIQTGGANIAPPQSQTPQIVHTSSLVLRLEQELATAVEALVNERRSTAARESSFNDRLQSLEDELQAKDKKAQQLNTKWMNQFEQQAKEFEEQLQKLQQKQQQGQQELEHKERDTTNKLTELKKVQTKLSQTESDLRDKVTELEEARKENEKLIRKAKDLELGTQQLDYEKKNTLQDMELKAKQYSSKLDRMKEEWIGRLEKQREELQLTHEKEIRGLKQEAGELEKKWREVEHDAFILSSELQKWKDTSANREMEIEKLKQLNSMDKERAEQTIKAEREQLEAQTKATIAKMQQTLDEGHSLLLETTTKLEGEIRKNRDAAMKIVTLEQELTNTKRDLADKEVKLQSQQTSVLEAERVTTSNAGLISTLKSSNASLLEEVQALQKKLDQRAQNKADELKTLENDHKAYRSKTRARIEELEKELQEAQGKVTTLQQRNDEMKHEFDLALTKATSEQTTQIEQLQSRLSKQQTKLSRSSDHSSISLGEKDRMISQLRVENEQRAHAEALALHQLTEMEVRFKNEHAKVLDLETKLKHIYATTPDATQHQRLLQELAAAKQVAMNIQGRYREVQEKFDRQTVRQNALQQLLTRLQEEQQHHMYRVPGKAYLANSNTNLYRTLDQYPTTSTGSVANPTGGAYLPTPASFGSSPSAAVDARDLSALGGGGAPTNFSLEEEDLYRRLMRDQERSLRIRNHVREYARDNDFSSDDDEDYESVSRGSARGRSRSGTDDDGYLSGEFRVGRSKSQPRSSSASRSRTPRGRTTAGQWNGARSSPARTRDDADVNLNLKVNFDPSILKRIKDFDAHHCCLHATAVTGKPHDSRSCKVCQRRAFGRGTDLNQHYGPEQHIPTRISPNKRTLPHL